MTENVQDQAGQIAVPLKWVRLDEERVILANQFIMQFDRDGFTLSVGQSSQPVLLGGSNEELMALAREIQYVPVRTVGRFAIPPGRLQQLFEIMQSNLAKYEETFGAIEKNASSDVSG